MKQATNYESYTVLVIIYFFQMIKCVMTITLGFIINDPKYYNLLDADSYHYATIMIHKIQPESLIGWFYWSYGIYMPVILNFIFIPAGFFLLYAIIREFNDNKVSMMILGITCFSSLGFYVSFPAIFDTQIILFTTFTWIMYLLLRISLQKWHLYDWIFLIIGLSIIRLWSGYVYVFILIMMTLIWCTPKWKIYKFLSIVFPIIGFIYYYPTLKYSGNIMETRNFFQLNTFFPEYAFMLIGLVLLLYEYRDYMFKFTKKINPTPHRLMITYSIISIIGFLCYWRLFVFAIPAMAYCCGLVYKYNDKIFYIIGILTILAGTIFFYYPANDNRSLDAAIKLSDASNNSCVYADWSYGHYIRMKGNKTVIFMGQPDATRSFAAFCFKDNACGYILNYFTVKDINYFHGIQCLNESYITQKYVYYNNIN